MATELSRLGDAVRRHPKRALWMAARTASVSYKSEVTEFELSRAFASGEVPQKIIAHVVTLLEEAPWALIVMAVEEVSVKERTSHESIWRNVALISEKFDVVRSGAVQ